MADTEDDLESIRILNALENIDDDCDRHGIILVKIEDPEFAQAYGIDVIPSLVYFEHKIPHLYEGESNSKKGPLKTRSIITTIKMLQVIWPTRTRSWAG